MRSKIDDYTSEIKMLKEKWNNDDLKNYEAILRIKEEDCKKLKEEYIQKEREYKKIIEDKDNCIKKMSKDIDNCKKRNKELLQKLSKYIKKQ